MHTVPTKHTIHGIRQSVLSEALAEVWMFVVTPPHSTSVFSGSVSIAGIRLTVYWRGDSRAVDVLVVDCSIVI